MPSFVVVRDEVGAEVERVTFDDGGIVEVKGWKVRRRVPRNITPISMDAAASGTVKGAAWGFVLAGPLGAAVGSMIGGGPKVTFELVTADGETWRCIAGRSAYLDLKRVMDRALLRAEKARARAPGGTGAGKPANPNWWLVGGAMAGLVLVGLVASRAGSADGVGSSAPVVANERSAASLRAATSAGERAAKPHQAPILDGAVTAYTSAKYPKTAATWGNAGLKRINKLMADAAQAVSKDSRCEAVESVDLSDVRSEPPYAPVAFVDCINNRRFYIGQDELRSLPPPEKRLPHEP